jgi:hypothetical protein
MSFPNDPSSLSFSMPLSWQVATLRGRAPLFAHTGIKFPCVLVLSKVWCARFEEVSMDSFLDCPVAQPCYARVV